MQRNQSIDIAKAVGIILMVVGHFNGLPLWFEKWIFSFHMPLFFILSGYLFKPKTEILVIKGGIKSLILPYIYTTVISILMAFLLTSQESAINAALGSFYGCQGNPSAKFILSKFQAGPIWFLLSLFWCRIYFSLVYKYFKNYLLICVVVGIFAAIFSIKILNVPLCIVSGAVSLIFYASGAKLKEIGFDKIKGWHYCFMVFVWLFCSQFGYLNMAGYMYHPYFVSIIGAVFGSIVVLKICSFVKNGGGNSLYVFCGSVNFRNIMQS